MHNQIPARCSPHHTDLSWAYLIVMLAIMLTACNPLATATQKPILGTSTKMPLASSPAVIPTSTLSPTATQEIYPTFMPAPTSTALPTLRPGQSLILASIHMMDERNGWGIDAGEHIAHTMDGGHTWKDVTPRNGAYRNSGFFALDANTAWATPYQWPCYTENCAPHPNNASVWHTSDGGQTWTNLKTVIWNGDLDFVSEQTGWAIATDGDVVTLVHTVEGGKSWEEIKPVVEH